MTLQHSSELRKTYIQILGKLGAIDEKTQDICEFCTKLIDSYGYLEAELQSRVEDVGMLHTISRSLMTILDVDALLKNIVETVKKHLSVESCSLLLLDEKREFMKIKAASGARFDQKMMKETMIPVGKGISGTVAETGEPILIKDIENDEIWGRKNRQGYGSRSLLCVPMKAQGVTIGVMNVNEKTGGRSFDEYDLELLSILAGNASVAIFNANLYNQLKNKENLISSITQSVTSGLMAINTSGEILLINRALSRFLKIQPQLASHQFYDDVLDPEFTKILEPIIERGRNMGLTVPEIIEVPQQSGETLPLEVSAVLLRDDYGDIMGLLLGFRDMSESREIDNLRRLNQMKSNFVSVASHELRTPLTAMIASLALLETMNMSGLNESQISLIQILNRNSKRLLKLANDLLDLSRLESQTLSLNLHRVKLKSLINGVYDAMLMAAQSKKVDLVLEVSEDLEFLFDEEKFEQVLLNLVSNAIKFTPEEGRITISAKREDDCLRVEVADTGIGLDEDERERIFDTFYQVEEAQVRTTQGTGLGLSICKKIVQLHKGSIEVQGEEGKGSTFVIVIPPQEDGKKNLGIPEQVRLGVSSSD